MKIFYLTGCTFPSKITHTLSIMRMCQAFADAGHRVMLSASGEGEDADVIGYYGLRGGFTLALKRFAGTSPGKLLRVVRALRLAIHHRRQIRAFGPEFIYSRLTLVELLFVPRTLPIIYEMHSLGYLGKGWFAGLLFRLLVRAKNFRCIVVTTDALAQLLQGRFPGVEVVVARLSADPPLEISAEEETAFRAQNLQGGSFDYQVGYTGDLDTVGLRGTEVICRCAAHMPSVAFHVVGGDLDVVAWWRAHSEQYNIQRNLFFYGHRNPSEMPFFLSNFDLVLAPLQWVPTEAAPIGAGMSPLKLPQYMAYRKAIVASDIPSHREVLADGETALLVTCDDIEAWVQAIRQLLNDPTRREAMGAKGFEVYCRGFTAQGRVKKILEGLDGGQT
jgi:glycosyltransferase involved in cell wall biosynthesis